MDKKEVKAIIRSLITSSDTTYGLYSLNKDFKEVTGMDIPLFGYGSLSSFLESLSDTVKLTGSFPLQKVSLVLNNTSGHIASLVKRQRRDKKHKKGTNTSGGNFVKSRRRSSKHKDKLNTSNDSDSDFEQSCIPELVQKVQLPKNDSKPRSTKYQEVSKNMPGCSQKAREKHLKSGKKKSLNKEKTRKSKSEKEGNSDEQTEIFLGLYSGKSRWAKKIGALDLKLIAKVGFYVEVCPFEITNPGNFYFHFRQFKKKLSVFMDDLQKFYNDPENVYDFQKAEVGEVGAISYSRYGGAPLWYRVQVEEIMSKKVVVVRLVDYGITAKVLLKNLKCLPPDFIAFPKQAVLGSLGNIKPFGKHSKWSKASTRRFYELAFCRDLIGGVVEVDSGKYKVSLALTSTKGEEVHINDTLVEECFAEFDFEVDSEDEKIEKGRNSPKLLFDSPVPSFSKENKFQNQRLQTLFS